MFSLKLIILISVSLLIYCKHPILYQLNARAWLYELSKKYETSITKIKDIPSAEFDYLQENNIDIVWVMGVWKLGKYGLEFDKKLDYSTYYQIGMKMMLLDLHLPFPNMHVILILEQMKI